MAERQFRVSRFAGGVMSVMHKNYGPAVNVPRASPTGSDARQAIGSIATVWGEVEIVDYLSDGKVRRRKAAAGMTLRVGDSVITGEGSAAVRLANLTQRIMVLSNSGCFFP
jgi:hypothetical protein